MSPTECGASLFDLETSRMRRPMARVWPQRHRKKKNSYINFGRQLREEWDGLGMWRVWVRRGGCIGSWWGDRREGDHWGDLGVDGWIILGWISRRCDVGIWTGLGWDRWLTLVNAVMKLRVPWNAGNFLSSCKPVSFSRRTLHHGVSEWVSE